jgi:Lon protease-like protein
MYQKFPDATLQGDWHCQRQALLDALTEYGRSHGMQVQTDNANRFTDVELVNLLSVSLPFHPAEKQALLEAPSLKDREIMLVDLLRLGTGPSELDSEIPSRTVN